MGCKESNQTKQKAVTGSGLTISTFILVGNQDMHKSLDEFEFWSDPTTDKGVSCPWVLKNIVSPSFLVCFYSDLFYT